VGLVIANCQLAYNDPINRQSKIGNRQSQPTGYRQVVLTSLPRSNSSGNRAVLLSNTLTEHYWKFLQQNANKKGRST